MSREPVSRVHAELEARLGVGRVGRDVPLGPYTTFKVGGPADLYVEPRSGAELVTVLTAARDAGVPVTLLGGGSNVLVGDAGVRGLVLRPRGGAIALEAPGRVRADAAVTINGLVRWTIGRGLAGLEAWAGTPGTVGGGVYGNAHWGGRLLGDLLETVRLWEAGTGVVDEPAADMEFAYDQSRLPRTREVLISAVFIVTAGDPAVLRGVARGSLAYRKRTQPLESPSAGCVFQNPLPGEAVPEGIPRSAGALVDRAGLKGARIGGARVSPTHANFIVNEGGATAADVRALIETARAAVADRFGILLRDEIVYLGSF
jgi:UDP-N-acetylmuramate dehydrogenase